MLEGFSNVAANCSVAGIYMTCKCQLSKLRKMKYHQINSIVDMAFSVQKKTFDFCRPALLALWLVRLVARVRGCLLWLAATIAAASVVGVIKRVRPGRSAEARLKVEAAIVRGTR